MFLHFDMLKAVAPALGFTGLLALIPLTATADTQSLTDEELGGTVGLWYPESTKHIQMDLSQKAGPAIIPTTEPTPMTDTSSVPLGNRETALFDQQRDAYYNAISQGVEPPTNDYTNTLDQMADFANNRPDPWMR